MTDFEKLGAFYLGREVDLEGNDKDALLYDSKDLTTHALCVGMTGSGKTGLCISLLEEAAIDGVPALVIDPKGDMGNLLLTFPKLRPADFEPWMDPSIAARNGQTIQESAASTAELWKTGLKKWGQDGARIKRLRDSADISIYTPGSRAGRPLRVLKSFDVPPLAIREDQEALSERLQVAISSLLTLVGVSADPVQSREAILLSNLVQHAWQHNKSLDIADLIHGVQKPPFESLGVLDLETFYPSDQRFSLAMKLNGLLASPKFASWLEGEPLDVSSLLNTKEGKPRLSILSIAHLSEEERMFFVTLLLGEVLSWMRAQPGTSSLRALLYMDEIFGYFPPTRQPPSKRPMLTLLKQARAYGLGVVLATQNPVDLDYKGLSNTGTWFLGRLQTERDKQRVLDGLEGAMSGQGKTFDRRQLEATLSGLGKRVFLMNNVHEDAPCLFKTRWAMSYLRGPLSRQQIRKLAQTEEAPKRSAKKKAASAAKPPRPKSPPPPVTESAPKVGEARPVVPADIQERFLRLSRQKPLGTLVYAPSIWTTATLHFVNARAELDLWKTMEIETDLSDQAQPVDWETLDIRLDDGEMDAVSDPESGARFDKLSSAARRERSYSTWAKRMKTRLYQDQALTLYRHREMKLISTPDETEAQFRSRLRLASHEARDLAIEKLRTKYEKKFDSIKARIRKAEDRLDREEDQYQAKRNDSWLSIGGSLLGALLGRKKSRSSQARRASSAARSASRLSKEKDDIARAKRTLEDEHDKFRKLEQDFERDAEKVREEFEDNGFEVEEMVVKPRKSDIQVEIPWLVWKPFWEDAAGNRYRGFLEP